MEPAENHKPRILIIDDEEQIRSLLIDLLSGTYQCSDAGSAEEALAALSQETFDLVISDIDMGGMSGLELVLNVFRAWTPGFVVSAVSSMSFLSHFDRIAKGVLDLSSIVFYLSLIASLALIVCSISTLIRRAVPGFRRFDAAVAEDDDTVLNGAARDRQHRPAANRDDTRGTGLGCGLCGGGDRGC